MVDKEAICLFEFFQDYWHIPFLSVKSDGSENTIVLNPHYYRKLENFGLPQRYGFLEVSEPWLEKVCAHCQLCSPTIFWDFGTIPDDLGMQRDSYRIMRKDYSHEKKEIPLYTIQTFTPSGERDESIPTKRICVVDDFDSRNIPEGLANRGHHTMFVKINPHIDSNRIKETLLIQAIIDWRPDCLICDKGLGFVNGLHIIERCKEEGIFTIMFTGEIQTDETRKVADIFFEKGSISNDDFLRVIP